MTKICYEKKYIDCCDTRCTHFERRFSNDPYDPDIYGMCCRNKKWIFKEDLKKPFPDFCELEDF